MFDIIVPAEQAKFFQGKSLEYACKTFLDNPILGRFPAWRGALKDEFFSAAFVGGLLEVSVAEREFYLGDVRYTSTYAQSYSLRDLTKQIEGMEAMELYQEKMKFYQTISRTDQENITLSDIMVTLDWNYLPFARVDEDSVNEVCLSSFSS